MEYRPFWDLRKNWQACQKESLRAKEITVAAMAAIFIEIGGCIWVVFSGLDKFTNWLTTSQEEYIVGLLFVGFWSLGLELERVADVCGEMENWK